MEGSWNNKEANEWCGHWTQYGNMVRKAIAFVWLRRMQSFWDRINKNKNRYLVTQNWLLPIQMLTAAVNYIDILTISLDCGRK